MVARHCRGVVGIDLSLSSIEDARFNATHNKVYNAEFFNGRVEKHFQRLMEQLDVAPDIVAIVNPSRIGLGMNLSKNETICIFIFDCINRR